MEAIGCFVRLIIALIIVIFGIGFVVSVGALMIVFILCVPVAFLFFLFA